MSQRLTCIFSQISIARQVSIAVLLVGLLVGPAAGIGVGDAAPDFSLTGIDGSPHNLGGYGSHPVLIMFLQHDDATALTVAPQIQMTFQTGYSPRLIVLGVETSGCSRDDLLNFRDQTGVDFALLLNGGPVLSEYGLPRGSLVLVDANGIVKCIGSCSMYDESALKAAVDLALRDAAATEAITWGLIKNLYK